MASSSASSSLHRFNSYLNSLQEEFELQSSSSTKESSQRRFSIFLGGLKSEFELVSLEIQSLQNERYEYKKRVEMQAKELEDLRRMIQCERCGNQIVHKQSTSVHLTGEETDDRPLNRKDHPAIPSALDTKCQSSDTVAASKSVTIPSSPPSTSTVGLDSGPEQQNWSITFNNKVRKELDVQLAHTLYHKRTILCVNFSQDGKYLAGGCEDGNAYIYDVQTGNLTCVLRNLFAEYQYIAVVHFNHDGKYLVTGSTDGEIFFWEIKTKRVRKGFRGHIPCISLRFSPSGRSLLSTSKDSVVWLWNLRCGTARVFIDDDPLFSDYDYYLTLPHYTSAVFSPDGQYIAASHMDGLVRIWDVRTARLMRRLDVHTNWVYDVGFMPNGKGLVSASRDKSLRYWDVSSLDATRIRGSQMRNESQFREVEEQTQAEREFLGHESSIYHLAISPDGRWVASDSAEVGARIWDARTAAMQCILDYNHWGVTVDFSPAGGYLASGAKGGMVRIWRYSCISPYSSQVPARE